MGGQQNEAPHPGVLPRLSRRRAILGFGGALGAAAAGAGIAAAHPEDTGPQAPNDTGWTFGKLESIDGPDRLTVVLRTGEKLSARLTGQAQVLREGPSSLARFSNGEAISLEGEKGPDGVLIATALEPLYRIVETRITSQHGATLETEAGPLRLDRNSSRAFGGGGLGHRVRKQPLDTLAGTRVVVGGRDDIRTGELIALRVGVIADG